ncbi:MAG: helix-turn-helix transcriptional regulator [Vallitaleaceae bacterium]|jgi:DNA-binding CsgD family transcriptional regulator|nr:helix-turn-helix transcriptional regulator [Vallitaleaceae bacterium]
MEHIVLLIHMITLLTGLTATTLGYLLYLKYKVKAIKYYTFFVLSTNLTVLLTAISNYIFYNSSTKIEGIIDVIYYVLFEMFLILITYSFIRFSTYIIKKSFGWASRIYILIGMAVVLFGVIMTLIESARLSELVLSIYMEGAFAYVLMALFFAFVYYSIMIAKNFKFMDNLDLKRAIQTFATCFLIYIPLQAVVIGVFQNEVLIFISRNLFYLMIDVISIVFAAKYFFIDTPGIIEEIIISDYFVEKYHITVREKEIIELMLSGLSIKEIGGKIDRAFKTVNNHLYNIYRKTDVTSKMELLNLIKENSI